MRIEVQCFFETSFLVPKCTCYTCKWRFFSKDEPLLLRPFTYEYLMLSLHRGLVVDFNQLRRTPCKLFCKLKEDHLLPSHEDPWDSHEDRKGWNVQDGEAWLLKISLTFPPAFQVKPFSGRWKGQISGRDSSHSLRFLESLRKRKKQKNI